MKFVLFLVLIVVVVWMLRGALRRRVDPPSAEKPAGKSAAQSAELPEDMVACAQCGVHLPRSEALPGRGGLFCGDAHRRAFEQGQPQP
jgi:uncharacterized protein